MYVLDVAALYDPAGDGWRTKVAFDHHSEWTYRATVRRPHRFGYPVDLPWSEAKAEWGRADVLHLQLGFEAEGILGVRPKPAVVHHHGTLFRGQYLRLLREQRRRKMQALVSTLDLWLMAPDELIWSPTPYDLDWLASFRKPEPGVLRIAHAPTNRTIKSTEAFVLACGRLASEVPLEIVLIEERPWIECLTRKGGADIYFDQVRLGYGANAVEAWGMGIPVIAGGEDATLAEIQRRAGEMPFLCATESTIYDALRRLVEPGERKAWAERGQAFARRFHAEEVVVRLLEAVFARA